MIKIALDKFETNKKAFDDVFNERELINLNLYD